MAKLLYEESKMYGFYAESVATIHQFFVMQCQCHGRIDFAPIFGQPIIVDSFPLTSAPDGQNIV